MPHHCDRGSDYGASQISLTLLLGTNVGPLVGKKGAGLKYIREVSNARMSLERAEDMDHALGGRRFVIRADTAINCTIAQYHALRVLIRQQQQQMQRDRPPPPPPLPQLNSLGLPAVGGILNPYGVLGLPAMGGLSQLGSMGLPSALDPALMLQLQNPGALQGLLGGVRPS
mmetsp:Transcript_141250/g.316720  ORF Transcript_141250/g.316720 Transcript_141250/m.316720 type:complete len:171 (-) Transcript_141250:53-565(-)